MDQTSVSVTLVEQEQPAGATPAHDAVWLELEEQLLGDASTSSQTALLAAKYAKLSGKARQALARRYRRLAQRRDVAIVGEPIRVRCRLRNPIKVPVEMSDVQVHATGVEYRCDPQVIVVPPREEIEFVCEITPLAPGDLKVESVHYRFSGEIEAEMAIQPRGRRLNNTDEERKSVVYGEVKFLDVHVLPPVPRMRAELLEFPEQLRRGEARMVVLQLTNEGATAINSVQVHTSHPAFSAVGVLPDELDPELPSANPSATSVACGDADWQGAGGITAVNDMQLAPGESTMLPVWVHGAVAGSHELQWLVKYSGAGMGEELPYRAVALLEHLNVDDSLAVRHEVLAGSVLAIHLENKSPFKRFSVLQTSTLSETLALRPLSVSPESVAPLESMTLHYSIEAVAPGGDSSALLLAQHQHGSESLGVDMASFPCFDLALRSKVGSRALAKDALRAKMADADDHRGQQLARMLAELPGDRDWGTLDVTLVLSDNTVVSMCDVSVGGPQSLDGALQAPAQIAFAAPLTTCQVEVTIRDFHPHAAPQKVWLEASGTDHWCGVTRRAATLVGDGVFTATLQAAFRHPGAYALGGVRAWVEGGEPCVLDEVTVLVV